MNPYQNNRRWKYFLLSFAIVIAVSSLAYTDFLVKNIAKSERTRAELWAKSLKTMFETDNDEMMNFLFVIRDSLPVPAIVTNEKDSVITYQGLDTTKTYFKVEEHKKYDPAYFNKELRKMKSQHKPIPLEFYGQKNLVYYKDSNLLSQLRIFPYIQLSLIAVFLLLAYTVFNSSRKSEQDQVWVGMAKETAHQLGTPVSSLMAWLELLKDKLPDNDVHLVGQMENDIQRLEVVADRFSKIGSRPVLSSHNVYEVIKEFVDYFKVRISERITFSIQGDQQAEALLNVPLFDWVIENILKNAVNAIEGHGKISIDIKENPAKKQVIIDITDTGKGISKYKFETVFQPGYTTRKRGWGLGLSLTKRMVENYHKGAVFVKESEIGKGTTFRIILKSNAKHV